MENTKTKAVFSTELAWVLGIIFTALGVALMEKPDFGLSMVVAPAYIIHLKLVQIWPFFTFGTSEYVFQLLLLIVMSVLLGRFSFSFLFSFVTAVLYGFSLDLCISLVSGLPTNVFAIRVLYYAIGILLCAAGVSMMFHTYLPPEVYELFVKQLSSKYGININRFKTCYDLSSMALGVILSFCFFGLWHFEGIKLGTIVCAAVNGLTISLFTKLYERFFTFENSFPKLYDLFNR